MNNNKIYIDTKVYIDTIEFKEPLKVDYNLIFDNISSEHIGDCCERHELDFENTRKEFELVEDTLSKIDKLEIYWEVWMWVTFFFYDWDKRVWIFVPWRGNNNWYYSDDLTLIIDIPWTKKITYDITEYQDY